MSWHFFFLIGSMFGGAVVGFACANNAPDGRVAGTSGGLMLGGIVGVFVVSVLFVAGLMKP